MSDVAEMVAWLRREIETDREAAEDAVPGPWWDDTPDAPWGESPDAVVTAGTGVVARLPVSERGGLNALHIERHDPQDVIADADAKLSLLDHYRDVCRFADPVKHPAQEYVLAEGAVRRAVMLLAQGYRHRDGWKDEWATSTTPPN